LALIRYRWILPTSPLEQLAGQSLLKMRIGSQFFVMGVTFEILVRVSFISMPMKEYFDYF